jgi:hypothetical protein
MEAKNMARTVKRQPAPPSLSTAEKAELRRLLDLVEPFDTSNEAYDVGENPPRGLIAALEFVEAHGITTSARLRAFRCRGERWLIDSRVMSDLRQLLK